MMLPAEGAASAAVNSVCAAGCTVSTKKFPHFKLMGSDGLVKPKLTPRDPEKRICKIHAMGQPVERSASAALTSILVHTVSTQKTFGNTN